MITTMAYFVESHGSHSCVETQDAGKPCGNGSATIVTSYMAVKSRGGGGPVRPPARWRGRFRRSRTAFRSGERLRTQQE